MARKGGIKGARKLRKLLAAADRTTGQHVKRAMEAIADDVLMSQLGLVPREWGDLAGALRASVSKAGLRARIGLISKNDRRDYFYATFLEFGTRGYVGMVRPGIANRRPYHVSIPPMAPRPFIGPSFDLNRDNYIEALMLAKRKAFAELARRYF